ncbi:uncharacterized protein LOC125758663 [Rhipicephalus sanguineus]|uniref:uncharacterized protein LOC125758663 n=1 Tax=Rhipicephalus sanguineus TaxID=34632 RepID=UPI0020C381C1|nr:uncharacterized protein LOC125758663 [Rhipicephalus sanguineus]
MGIHMQRMYDNPSPEQQGVSYQPREKGSGLEHALLDSGVGFKLDWSDDGTPTTWTLPGLVFADDLVLLAENKAQLQHLVETSANHLNTLGLAFNPKKSAVLRFSGDCGEAAVVLPNGEELPRLEEYRYLGVILSTSDKLIAGHETHLRQVAQRANRILRRQCLCGCSRYHMVRDLWKAVHVPGLTYTNSAICLSAPTRDWLERGQREVGRIALGCHGRVAVEPGGCRMVFLRGSRGQQQNLVRMSATDHE